MHTMKKTFFILFLTLSLCLPGASAQDTAASQLEQRAKAESAKGSVAGARFSYIRAYEDYVQKGQLKQGVDCGVKATALYYKENMYKEAFDLLRHIDQSIEAKGPKSAAVKAALRYYTSKERYQMYMKMHRQASALDHLRQMESHANTSVDEDVKNDLLYTKTLYYYTFGQNEKGNATFRQMASKLTQKKEYGKVDEVYKALIASGRRSNSAGLVAQSYKSYMAWKDSVAELKRADETGALKRQIAANEASIAEKDSSLASRSAVIVGLSILAAALAAALAVGAVVLLRFIILSRKQKKTIRIANENNALKARFISNISAQLEPTLKKLDGRQPEVKALQLFADHIQTLSHLEEEAAPAPEMEETQVAAFCETLMEGIRDKAKSGVSLTVNAPKMSVMLCRPYVEHILRHLLDNAATFTPEGGHITLEFKKRGAHKHQFLVSDTGQGIPEEKRADVFKPFLEVHDLTQGDGLGLPICRQMAIRMDGELDIDPAFTKGTRFVLDLKA